MRIAVLGVVLAVATIACNAIVGFGDLTKQPAAPDSGKSGDDDDTTGDDDDDTARDGGTSSSSSSGDGGSSSGVIAPACNPTADFGAPQQLPGPVNTSSFENSPSLTDDELTIVFQRSVSNKNTLMIATRAKVTDQFGEPTTLALTSSNLSYQPSISRDGLTLFWAEVQDTMDVFFATRATVTGTFANPNPTGVANPSFGEFSPVVTGDGNELFYTSDQNGVNKPRLYHATRNGAEFGNPQKLQELADGSDGDEEAITVSKDGLTIFFGSTRSGGLGDLDIWTAHRASRSEKFTGITHVNNVSSSAIEWPSYVSADGCRLYFGSERDGNGNLWVASRP